MLVLPKKLMEYVNMFGCTKVTELESPLGVLPIAVLRSPDIVSFTVSLPQDTSRETSWFVHSRWM